MISLILRSIGTMFFFIGVVALVLDLFNSVVVGNFSPKLLGQQIYELFPAQLGIAQAAIQRYVAAWIWDPVIQWLLNLPTFVNFMVLGVIIYFPTIWLRRWV